MYFAVNSYLILIAVTLDIMLKYTWSTWRQGYNKWNPKPLAITVITNFMREDTFTKLFLSKLSFNRKKNFLINFQIFQASVLNIRVGTKLVLDYIHGLSKS